MVQFGKTLNDGKLQIIIANIVVYYAVEPYPLTSSHMLYRTVVKSDWRCHAVAYMELKQQITAKDNTKEDDDSVHSESSYCIS